MNKKLSSLFLSGLIVLNTIKEENTKTYDGGLGSYTLSGIGSLGLLSMFNKRNRRKNNIK